MDSSTEDLSYAGVDRYMGETVALNQQDISTDLPQLFVGQKSELMGEVLPREQDSGFKAMHEMVVTTIAEPACDETNRELSGHISEESQMDSTESQLVPNPGYGDESGLDRWRAVSTDLGLHLIPIIDGKSKQDVEELIKKVKELKERLDKEMQTKEEMIQQNTELKHKLEMSMEQVKTKEKRVEELEGEVKCLRRELEKEKEQSRLNSEIQRLTTVVSSHTEALQAIQSRRENNTAVSIENEDQLSPTQFFPILRGVTPPYPEHNRTLTFAPSPENSPTLPPQELQLHNLID